MNPPRSMIVSSMALLIGVSACSTLPRSGPADGDVEKSAAVKVANKDRRVGIDYVLLDLNAQALPYFETAPGIVDLKGFGDGRGGGAPAELLGVGDVVQVSIFESAAGGLFIPSEAGSRPGNYVTLPSQTIGRSGTLTVPYAGSIRAAGRTIEATQSAIAAKLADRAIEPQVLITLAENRSRQVSVLGDVNDPAKLDINPAGERILDVIARAGGLSTPGVETYVTLQRRGREATVLFSHLVNDAAENIFVAPGDTVYVNRERRTFLAFGASGLNGRIDFEESNLTLGDALGKAGGLLDSRADPAQVFIYRLVDRSTLAQLRIDTSRFRAEKVPVIFRINLRDPSGFFAVQKFPMVDKDILYVSNSASTELSKFLEIVTMVTGSAANVTADSVTVGHGG